MSIVKDKILYKLQIKKFNKVLITLIIAGIIHASCVKQPRIPPSKDFSDQAELEQMDYIAGEVLNLDIGNIERKGSEYNFVAIKSDNILFSRRLDSRTYFVQDIRYGNGNEAGIFQGSNEELKQISRDIFRKLDIPLSEVAEEIILQENTQIAEIDPATGTVNYEEPQKGQRLVRFTRAIDGIPVFSSSLTLGLTNDNEIGFMELHWPEIPKNILIEANRLHYKVQNGWHPPELKGAIVESVDAGIVHSSAPGLILDIYPAIRVIYTPVDEKTGRKPTLYLDRHGNTIPFPRQFDLPPLEPKERQRVQEPK